MDKRWQETFTRLDGIEEQLAKLVIAIESPPSLESVLNKVVTKEEIMKIKGVGSATADQIMELLSR